MNQRGFVWWVYAIAIALIVGVGATAVLTYNNAIKNAAEEKERADTAEALFFEQKDENTKLEARRKALDTQLAARRRNDQATADKERQRDAALKKARDTDPEARKWLDARVPDSILASVRDNEQAAIPKDAKGNAAISVAPAHAAPSVAGNDAKRRPFGLRAPAPKAIERVQ